MSTKAIRELAERTVKQGGTIGKDALTALAEVDAIERAAKTMDAWNRNGQKRLDPDMARSWRLVESIAKDVP